MNFHERLSLAPLLAAGNAPEGPFNFLYIMKGPEFIWLYWIWFLALFVVVVILRARGHGNWRTTFTAVFLFEIVGLVRYLTASSMGMHRFGLLFLSMVSGMCFLVFRFKDSKGNGEGGGVIWLENNSGGNSSGGCGSSG